MGFWSEEGAGFEGLNRQAGERLFVACMSLFGIRRVGFAIPFVRKLVTALGILGIAVLTAGVSGGKTRKMRPVEMIVEE